MNIQLLAEKIDKIRPKVNKMRPTLIGKTAPNLILADSTEKNWINLKSVKHKYTLLIFWADDCGHCHSYAGRKGRHAQPPCACAADNAGGQP